MTTTKGFVMIPRGPNVHELLRDPLAFALLAQIAMRARWRSAFSADDLELGEAKIGDFKSLGMTRAQYRTRIKRLEKWEQITIRITSKGTIAKLISSLVFDINLTELDSKNNQLDRQPTTTEPPTDHHQTTNQQPLTKKDKKERMEKDDSLSSSSSAALSEGVPESPVALIERMQTVYPSLNSRDEYELFLKQADARDFKPTAQGFENYMKRARPRLRRLRAKKIIPPAAPEPCSEPASDESIAKFKKDNREIFAALRPE